MVFWILLVACSGGSSPAPIPEVEVEPEQPPETTPYVLEVDEPEASLSLEQIGEGIENGISLLLQLDPTPLHDAYESIVMANEDEDCPNYVERLDDAGRYDYWNDHCETASGVRFQGWGQRKRYPESWDGDHYMLDDGYINGEFEVLLADGTLIDFSGRSDFYEKEESDQDLVFDLRTYGSFKVLDGQNSGTWLQQELAVDIDLRAYEREESRGGGRYYDLEGGISGMSGVVSAFHAESFYLHNEAYGSHCELEPYGRVSVRDEAGQWYHVEFDGPAYNGAWSYTPDCDGCGMVWYRGEPLGQACASFDALLVWNNGVRPW
ncbi:MAG: hypothetical protein VX519_05990 [Myxococcota bacterium]|nr:hypothetical protein [Myxococcota bacterium]